MLRPVLERRQSEAGAGPGVGQERNQDNSTESKLSTATPISMLGKSLTREQIIDLFSAYSDRGR